MFMAKHFLKMMMVCLLERAQSVTLPEAEYHLLNIIRSMVCSSGIFERELNQIEQGFGGDASQINETQINEIMMVSKIDKTISQEK